LRQQSAEAECLVRPGTETSFFDHPIAQSGERASQEHFIRESCGWNRIGEQMNSAMANVNRPLRVVKFGGTSVGDAPRIRKVVEIVRDAARESDLVVVVSAMSGVTNKLVEAAAQSEAGNRDSVEIIFEELRERHRAVANALIHSVPLRSRINRDVEQVFQQGERLCQGTALLRELTLRVRDSVSSLGERLSAPIVAAALAECGVKSEAVAVAPSRNLPVSL
jgi:aspartate kinase